jgi:hypothetical protein
MHQLITTACAIALAMFLMGFDLNSKAQTESGAVRLVDPGFESFKLANAPRSGWFSDDAVRSADPGFAGVTMTPDSEVKVEGNYSLRIEQLRPRPNNRGQAFLAQAVTLPKKDGNRSFDLKIQTRGALKGPLTIHVYVWEPGNIAKAIAQRDTKVNTEWTTASLSFKVPNGYDQFGFWIYLPRDNEAKVWLDDVRLEAKVK